MPPKKRPIPASLRAAKHALARCASLAFGNRASDQRAVRTDAKRTQFERPPTGDDAGGLADKAQLLFKLQGLCGQIDAQKLRRKIADEPDGDDRAGNAANGIGDRDVTDEARFQCPNQTTRSLPWFRLNRARSRAVQARLRRTINPRWSP